jgi:S1-C subfamily serine protease
MVLHNRSLFALSLAAAAVLAGCGSPEKAPVRAQSSWHVRNNQIFHQEGSTEDLQLVPSNAARNAINTIFSPPALADNEPLRADQPRTRGSELTELYQKAGPAVVLILMPGGRGFGSGFLISEDGWLVTNHHVAEGAGLSDSLTRQVNILSGTINQEGFMEVSPEPLVADVYKWDETRDLALLKLRTLPQRSSRSLTPVKVSAERVLPGADVMAIGNAGRSLLWSIKPGQVQAVGRLAADSPEVFQMWEARTWRSAQNTFGGALDAVRSEIQKQLGATAQLLYIQATSPIMRGDSGGPLLNRKGEVVGVTCMVRTDPEALGVAHFFIAGSELREFLKDRPSAPMPGLLSPWESSPDLVKIMDRDLDGRPDTMACFRAVEGSQGREAVFLSAAFDLEEKSQLQAFADAPAQSARYDVEGIFKNKAMQFQAYVIAIADAFVFAADLDHDGWFETVRIDKDGDGVCDVALQSQKGKPPVRKELRGGESLLPRADEVPASWRERYTRVVLANFKLQGVH